MSKQINKLKSLVFGDTPIHMVNNEKPVDEVVIQYKDIYISMFIDIEFGEPTGDFAWSHDPTIFSLPIREIVLTKEGK